MFRVAAIELNEEERVELVRRARASTSQVRVARRAQAILLCADGVPLRQIGRAVDMDEHQVGVWRRRFLERRLDGLKDAQRPGRPRRFGHDERIKMAAIATSARSQDDPVSISVPPKSRTPKRTGWLALAPFAQPEKRYAVFGFNPTISCPALLATCAAPAKRSA